MIDNNIEISLSQHHGLSWSLCKTAELITILTILWVPSFSSILYPLNWLVVFGVSAKQGVWATEFFYFSLSISSGVFFLWGILATFTGYVMFIDFLSLFCCTYRWWSKLSRNYELILDLLLFGSTFSFFSARHSFVYCSNDFSYSGYTWLKFWKVVWKFASFAFLFVLYCFKSCFESSVRSSSSGSRWLKCPDYTLEFS